MIKGKRYFHGGGCDDSVLPKPQDDGRIPVSQIIPSDGQVAQGQRSWSGDVKKLKANRRAQSYVKPTDQRDTVHFGVFPWRWQANLTRSEILNWVAAEPRLRKMLPVAFRQMYRMFVCGERDDVAQFAGVTIEKLTTYLDGWENLCVRFIAAEKWERRKRAFFEPRPTEASLAKDNAEAISKRFEEMYRKWVAEPPAYLKEAIDRGYPQRLAEGFRVQADMDSDDVTGREFVLRNRDGVEVVGAGTRVRKSGKVYKRGLYSFNTKPTTRSKRSGSMYKERDGRSMPAHDDYGEESGS